ncbi:MAG TPA: putative quinol monooxygenase [Arachidicoccus sp.]
MKIYLTAIIKTKPEHRASVLSLLNNMVEQTRKEKACQLYNLHNGIEDENLFIFYEIWENQEGLEQHNQQPYLLEFGKIVEEKLQHAPAIYKTTLL